MKRFITILSYIIIPFIIVICFLLFGSNSYYPVSVASALLGCVPFFLSFEHKGHDSRKIVMLAIMTALSVSGRFMFAPLQFFKPVTAIVVISAMYFGSEFGFLTGALSALLSNFYFGQGPWTPFQMFSWGIIGLVAGLIAEPLKRNKILLIIYGVFSGAVYSLLMDIFTSLWLDGTFIPMRFLTAVATSLPIMIIYIISNVIFLLILTPLFGNKLERLRDKYGI